VSRTKRLVLIVVRLWCGLGFLNVAVTGDFTAPYRLLSALIGAAFIWWTIVGLRRLLSA